MQNQEISSSSSSSASSLISEWEQPLSNEELEAIDAIEAAFQQSSTRKRHSPLQNDNRRHCPRETRLRRLPSSVLALSMPFALSPCRQGVLPRKAAVMQLCIGTGLCHVMHIIHSGIPESLQFLLEDSTLLKVGVGIGNDSVKVFRDYNVSVKAVEELSHLAKEKIDGEPKSWSLQSLTEMLVCKELHKPNKIRLGNWEADVLSKAQLEYAATDAFASWQLYQVLKSLPSAKDSADEQSEEATVIR